jgi:AhpC/TSA family protein
MKSLIAITAIACVSPFLGGESLNTINSFTVREIGMAPTQIQVNANRATVVVFVSAICPMSADYSQRLTKLNEDYSPRGARIVLINSNDNETDEQVNEQRRLSGLKLPVYRDPSGRLAAQVQAYSTPTAVMLDQSGAIRYWGSIDDARNPVRVTKPYLQLAIDAVLAGRAVDRPRTRALGCSIKRLAVP